MGHCWPQRGGGSLTQPRESPPEAKLRSVAFCARRHAPRPVHVDREHSSDASAHRNRSQHRNERPNQPSRTRNKDPPSGVPGGLQAHRSQGGQRTQVQPCSRVEPQRPGWPVHPGCREGVSVVVLGHLVPAARVASAPGLQAGAGGCTHPRATPSSTGSQCTRVAGGFLAPTPRGHTPAARVASAPGLQVDGCDAVHPGCRTGFGAAL